MTLDYLEDIASLEDWKEIQEVGRVKGFLQISFCLIIFLLLLNGVINGISLIISKKTLGIYEGVIVFFIMPLVLGIINGYVFVYCSWKINRLLHDMNEVNVGIIEKVLNWNNIIRIFCLYASIALIFQGLFLFTMKLTDFLGIIIGPMILSVTSNWVSRKRSRKKLPERIKEIQGAQ